MTVNDGGGCAKSPFRGCGEPLIAAEIAPACQVLGFLATEKISYRPQAARAASNCPRSPHTPRLPGDVTGLSSRRRTKMACVSVAAAASRAVVAQQAATRGGKAVTRAHALNPELGSSAGRLGAGKRRLIRLSRRSVVSRAEGDSQHPEGERGTPPRARALLFRKERGERVLRAVTENHNYMCKRKFNPLGSRVSHRTRF